jgi:hypothetical protein
VLSLTDSTEAWAFWFSVTPGEGFSHVSGVVVLLARTRPCRTATRYRSTSVPDPHGFTAVDRSLLRQSEDFPNLGYSFGGVILQKRNDHRKMSVIQLSCETGVAAKHAPVSSFLPDCQIRVNQFSPYAKPSLRSMHTHCSTPCR